jgi:prostatic aicd phosphatase
MISIFILLVVLFFNVSVAVDKLKSVQVLIRHGDRAPSSPYPQDVYDDTYWPNGWSQLTQRGKEETYELGQFLRKRYSEEHNLLKTYHDPSQAVFRSTSKQRAIESAENVIRGLYPGESNNTVQIRVVSQHTRDLLLKPNSFLCKAYDRISTKDNTKLFRQYNKVFARFFQYLTAHTGYVVSMATIDKVFDAVFRETVHGLPQPDWLRQQFVDGVGKKWNVYELILELKRVQRLAEFNTPEEAKLRTGYLLGDILKRMQNQKTSTNASETFLLLSSHDATLTSILYGLGISNDLLTPYAAAVIFELYQDDSANKHYVQVLYRNETTHEPYPMRIPGCSHVRCELNNFATSLTNRIYRSKEEAVRECAKS